MMKNILPFLSYVFITTFTPGPNNIMSMSNASRYGFRNSIKFSLGIFAGFFIIIILCSAFSLALYSIIPAIRSVMTAIGAAYVLYLAWKTYNSKSDNGEDSKGTNTFMSGLLLQFVNPKGILYGITTVSTFIVPYYQSPLVLTAFSAMLAFIAFVATCCWATFGALFQIFLAKYNHQINVVMAVLLVYCAMSLFM